MDDISERVLTVQQRTKRAQQLRSRMPTVVRARARARVRFASQETLLRRARALARKIFRIKMAGTEAGAHYSDLSASQKIAIDKLISNRQKAIKQLAVRLIPVIRKAETARLQTVRLSNKSMARPKLPVYESYSDEDLDTIEVLTVSTCIIEGNNSKLDKLLRAGLVDKTRYTLYKKILTNINQSVKTQQYRDAVVKVLNNLIKLVTSDKVIYQRAINNLQTNNRKPKMIDESTKAKVVSGDHQGKTVTVVRRHSDGCTVRDRDGKVFKLSHQHIRMLREQSDPNDVTPGQFPQPKLKRAKIVKKITEVSEQILLELVANIGAGAKSRKQGPRKLRRGSMLGRPVTLNKPRRIKAPTSSRAPGRLKTPRPQERAIAARIKQARQMQGARKTMTRHIKQRTQSQRVSQRQQFNRMR